MTSTDPQHTYDRNSFSDPVTNTFHGNPACPACDEGKLWLWQIGMAFDAGGSIDHYTTSPPPDPRFRYEAVLMVCRDKNIARPGCGFTLPLHAPRTIDMQHMQAIADHVARHAGTEPRDPSSPAPHEKP